MLRYNPSVCLVRCSDSSPYTGEPMWNEKASLVQREVPSDSEAEGLF